MKALTEKGTSFWLTVLPLDHHGFALCKGDFHDAVSLRYGLPLPYAPATCSGGARFDPDLMLICRYRVYPTLRHNEI